MKQELVKKETNQVAVPTFMQDMSLYGATDSTDILIPKLLAMQGLSKYVAAEKAQMGDIVNSVTGEVLGGKKEAINFIPLKVFKTWVRYKYEKNSPMYIGTEEAKGQTYQWEEEIGGVKFRNDQVLNFYVMLEKDLTKPFALPYVLAFRRTSYTAGKKLNTQFEVSKASGIPPFMQTYALTTTKQQNDQGTFYTFDITPGKPTDAKFIPSIEKTFKLLVGAAIKVDDSDIVEETSKTTSKKTSTADALAEF
jgi:hypothetical protein